MLVSVGGQVERSARIAALQPHPQAQPGQDGGLSVGNAGTAATAVPPITAIAGSTTSPLSRGTNFLLAVIGGAGRSGNQTGPTRSAVGSVKDQATGQTQQPVNAQPGAVASVNSDASDGISGTSLVQELQALVSPDATITFALSGVASPVARRSGSAAGGAAVQNSNAAGPSWQNGWNSPPPGASDGLRQQVALAAYASGNLSRQGRATASVLQGLTA